MVNKIDRLILELRLDPVEAYERIKGIITQVNMIVSAFESESFMSEADAVLAHENIKASADAGYETMAHANSDWRLPVAGMQWNATAATIDLHFLSLAFSRGSKTSYCIHVK